MAFDELQRVKIAAGPYESFFSGTTTNLYVEKVFPTTYQTIEVSNDSPTDSIQFSYDGATLEGNLLPGENITVNVGSHSSVYIKGTAGDGAYRIWGF